MSKTLSFLAAVCLLTVPAAAVAQQAKPVSTTKPVATTPATIDDTIRAVRADLQGSRADIMAKNLTLTAEQAAKFWPVFDQYQKEQNVIMDEQMKGIQAYISGGEAMDDRSVLQLMNAHLDRDEKMAALRRRWLSDFQQVMPIKQAVRVMQIDRRLSLAQQTEFTAQIPLAQ